MYSIRVVPNVQHPPISRHRNRQRPFRAIPTPSSSPSPKPSTAVSDVERLLDKAIKHANEACCSENSQDIDCLIAWDEVNDLKKAYRQVVEKEKKEKMGDDFMTRLTPNSWDVLI
jgi:hypothetical protein